MTQYNTLNVKLSNSQLNKWISGIKKIVLKVSSIVVGNSNDENNFLHKFLLTNHKFRDFVKLLQIVHQLI